MGNISSGIVENLYLLLYTGCRNKKLYRLSRFLIKKVVFSQNVNINKEPSKIGFFSKVKK